MKKFSLFLLFLLLAAGCGRAPDGFRKFKTDYNASGFVYHQESGQISYVKGALPRKSYLVRIDSASGRQKTSGFPGYALGGNYLFMPETGQAVLSAWYVGRGEMTVTALRVDADRRAILASTAYPEKFSVVKIARPRGSERIWILLQNEKPVQAVLKQLDTSTGAESSPAVLGAYKIDGAWFLDGKPLLVLCATADEKTRMLVYDLKAGNIIYKTEVANGFQFLESSSGRLFGLVQQPAAMRGELVEFDLEKPEPVHLMDFDGEARTFIEGGRYLYVVTRDRARETEKNKYWLHAQDLYVINRDSAALVEKMEWSPRAGVFAGYDGRRDELYYAVTDRDDPAVWVMAADRATLSRAAGVIR